VNPADNSYGHATRDGGPRGLNRAVTTLYLRLERRGSKILSICGSILLHGLLLVLLWIMRQETALPAAAQDTPILMQIVMPPEPPPPPAAAEAAPLLPQVQRTSPNPSEEPNPEAPAVEPEAESEAEQPAVAELPDVPETPRKEEVAGASLDEETLEKWRRDLEQREAERQKTRTKLETVSTVVVEAPGVKRPYVTAGADHGTVRELDIERYPTHMQERFFRQFNIRIRRGVEPPAPGRSSWVNAAKTHTGTYKNVGPPTGLCDVMTLSREVQYRMAELELAEIAQRKMDPERTRVEEIVFGLREDPDGRIDLCVTRFRAVPIE